MSEELHLTDLQLGYWLWHIPSETALQVAALDTTRSTGLGVRSRKNPLSHDWVNLYDCKLILRSLETVTEEDAKAAGWQNVSDFIDVFKGRYNSREVFKAASYTFRTLQALGYDTHNHIAAGRAVDCRSLGELDPYRSQEGGQE